MVTGGSNIYVGRSRLRRKFRRQRQQKQRDSKKNKPSRGREGSPAPPTDEYKKLPRDEERKRPDSGHFSSGSSDSDEHLAFSDDDATSPFITGCEYLFYPHTPNSFVRGGINLKPDNVWDSGDVGERKQQGETLGEKTVLPTGDFNKFWDECCHHAGSDTSSDEGIQSGGAGSSGEESDDDTLWESFVEKINVWRLEEATTPENETAAPEMEAYEEKQEEDEEEENQLEEDEQPEVDEEEELLLKPEEGDTIIGQEGDNMRGQEGSVATLWPDTVEEAVEEGDSYGVATAMLVDIDCIAPTPVVDEPTIWMDEDDDEDDEDVVWQVNDHVGYSVKFSKGKANDSSGDLVKFTKGKKETYDVDCDVKADNTVEAAFLKTWKKLEVAGNSIKKAVEKQREPKKRECCSVM